MANSPVPPDLSRLDSRHVRAFLDELRSKTSTSSSGGTAGDHSSLSNLDSDDHKQYPIITTGTTAPTAVPARVGALYVDTTNGIIYVAVNSDSTSDWTALSVDATTVLAALAAATPTVTAVAASDYVFFQDVSDSNNIKRVQQSSLAEAAFELISTTEISSSTASVEFTGLGSSEYGSLLLVCNDVLPSASSAELLLQTSTNDGSTWKTTGYSDTNRVAHGSTAATQTSTTAIQLTDVLAVSTSAAFCQATVQITGVGRNATFGCTVLSTWDASPNDCVMMGGGGRSNPYPSQHNALKVFFSPGNINRGQFSLYGRRDA